jgi:hypothetical protein
MKMSIIQKSISKRKLGFMPIMDIVRGYEKHDGSLSINYSNAAQTPDAADDCRVNTLDDLATILQGIDASQDNMNAICNKVIVDLDVYSSATNFIQFPFFIIMENGETIASTSGTNTDPASAINEAVTGMYVLTLMEPNLARKIWDNSSVRYIVRASYDITNICNAYLKKYRNTNMDEQAALACELGSFIVCRTPNSLVTTYTTISCLYSLKPANNLI